MRSSKTGVNVGNGRAMDCKKEGLFVIVEIRHCHQLVHRGSLLGDVGKLLHLCIHDEPWVTTASRIHSSPNECPVHSHDRHEPGTRVPDLTRCPSLFSSMKPKIVLSEASRLPISNFTSEELLLSDLLSDIAYSDTKAAEQVKDRRQPSNGCVTQN